MKIINASFEVKHITPNALEQIEEHARTCYLSHDKTEEGSAEKLCRTLLKKGHHSMFRTAHMRVLFTVDRGVSHELVRHGLADFAQESTRYCNYSKGRFGRQITVVRPCFTAKLHWDFSVWQAAMAGAEKFYFTLLDGGWKPEEARSVLPNSLATKVSVTANLEEWRHIFKQRTHKAAHPQMREVMVPLLDEVKERVPVVFEDINPS